MHWFNMANGQGTEDYCHMNPVMCSQLECYHKLPAKDTALYRSLIFWASKIRPRVIGEIERQNPGNPICRAKYFNFIEGYDNASGYVIGLIWTDSVYYSYFNAGNTKGSKVERLEFSELDQDQKTIVLHFNDWANDVFSQKEKSPIGSVPGIYYFGTRADFSSKSKIESIAFCY
jgi:hypothetical protein